MSPFLSATASQAVSSGGSSNSGGYLSASKLGDGESFRFAIVSESPLEFWVVWGETDEGVRKPFRFIQEPAPSEIEAELGEFKQRMNFENTALEKPKFAICAFVYDYTSEEIKVLEIGQKTLLKELDALSNNEDYSDLTAWDLTISRTGLKKATEYRVVPGPRKKGFQAKIETAWSEAQSKGFDLGQLLLGGSPFGNEDG